MTRIHITASGKVAPCNASLRECPRGVDNHFDSMAEAVRAAERRAKQAAKERRAEARKTPMGNEAQESLGSEQGLLFTEQDAIDALDAREVTQSDLGRYLNASGHVFLVDAVRAKLRANDANGWRGWADAADLTTEDKHHIALRAVALDVDKWRDEAEDRLRPSATGQYHVPAERLADDASTLAAPVARDPRHRYVAVGAKHEEPSTSERAPNELDPAIIEALKLKYLKRFKVPFDESGLSIPELLQMAQRGELG